MNQRFRPEEGANGFSTDAGQNPSSAGLREAVLRQELLWIMQERDALKNELATARASGVKHDRRVRRLFGAAAPLRAALMRPLHRIRRLFGRAGGEAADIALTPRPGHDRQQREIFVAADFLPLFDQQGGALRLKTLIAMMGEAGWNITFGSLAAKRDLPGVLSSEEGRRRYEGALRDVGVNLFLYGEAEIGKFLAKSERGLDWAFLSFPAVASALIPLVRCNCPTTRIAFDMVDFHGVRMAREAALRGDPDLMREAEAQRAVEVACANAADVTFAIAPEEKATLLELAPQAVVEVLPIVFEIAEQPPPGPQGREGLLFVGGFWHKPNGDAMRWFVERIWPLIRRVEPSLRLSIAGSNPDEEILALASQPGVEVLGFVPDLTPLFNSHRALVAPLRFGAGTKVKVGQSLSQGLPVVATSVGAEGMGLIDGTHLLVGDDEEAFAAQVIRLLHDDMLWSRLSTQALAHMQNTLSVAAVRKQLEAVIGG